MKTDRSQGAGYTIVETMIFLAITGAMFTMATILLGGQQAKNEFNTGVREIESRLLDISNDVATGFYPNTDDFVCDGTNTTVGVRPTITAVGAGGGNQGGNTGCIFIGRVVHFAPAGTDRKAMRIYTIVGKQRVNSGGTIREVENFSGAVPTAIATGDPPLNTIPDISEQETLPGSLSVGWVRICNDSDCDPYTPVGALGFFSSFSNYKGSALQSGSGQVSLVPVHSTAVNATDTSTVNSMANAANYTTINPPHGILVCLNSGGTNQHARLRIGGNNRQLSTAIEIVSNLCP